MLLTNPLSSTKKLFYKTLRGFKSILHGGYQRLPKSSSFMNPFCCGCGGDMKVHESCKEYDDMTKVLINHKEPMKENMSIQTAKEPVKENEFIQNENFVKLPKPGSLTSRKPERFKQSLKSGKEERRNDFQKGKTYGGNVGKTCCCVRSVREAAEGSRGSNYLVPRKLRELELIMNMNTDVEHVLDIEELIHHYSRLTCPVYLDMIDKFFADMYTEFFCTRVSVGTNSKARGIHVKRS